nr:hypothetical protein [Tanacetum cinerariifolium]
MFKLNVSQSVSPISSSKTSCASKNVENKTKRKRRKRTSSKPNDKQVNNDILHANRDFVYFSDLDTLSSVRRPKHSSVIWKQKGSSNTSNVDFSSVSHSKLNKDVKRYTRKDLLLCNNSHLGDTRSVYACNDAMNVSCNYRVYASYDENDLFIFDDWCWWRTSVVAADKDEGGGVCGGSDGDGWGDEGGGCRPELGGRKSSGDGVGKMREEGVGG